jgi:hypothetical protein
MDEAFDEGEYYSGYKAIRNRFRRYTPISLLNGCIAYLYRPTKDEIEELRKQPWLVFLLLKWVFLDEESGLPGKRQASQNDVQRTLQMVLDLGGKARLPSQYEHYTLFFRNLAYQQFGYQRGINVSNFSRQWKLFCELDLGHEFRTRFHERTGLEPERFIALAIMLYTRFASQHTSPEVSSNWFEPVFAEYSRDEVVRFLKALSVPVPDIKTKLSIDDRGRRSYEYYEQTPFLRCPLIEIAEDKYLCTYPNVLYRALEHFIYDVLREWNASRFMQRFGGVFERYVERLLDYAGVRYVNENVLKAALGPGRLVDFLMTEGDANIFVDAKAVEMAYLGKVAHRIDLLRDKSDTSILSAIGQAFDVIDRIRRGKIDDRVVEYRSNNYLVVVTYKEMYLGNGSTFYDVVAKDKIEEFRMMYGADQLIPPENMFFVTIEEWELLLEAVRAGKATVAGLFEEAKRSDKSPETRKFDFLLHLKNTNLTDPPKYLDDVMEDVFGRIKTILLRNQ